MTLDASQPGRIAARDLRGQVALITGAGQGIGRAMAETLAAAGADIVLNHHRAATSMILISTLSTAPPAHPAMTPIVVPITNAVLTREKAMIRSIREAAAPLPGYGSRCAPSQVTGRRTAAMLGLATNSPNNPARSITLAGK